MISRFSIYFAAFGLALSNLLILDRAALIAVAGTLGLALGLNVGREAASVS